MGVGHQFSILIFSKNLKKTSYLILLLNVLQFQF